MVKGNCNVCGAVCSAKCSKCGSAFYCGREHQSRDWRLGHKASCPSIPPRPPTLEQCARDAVLGDVRTVNVSFSDEAYELLDGLCCGIWENGRWCEREHVNLTVLLDATRALRAIHSKAPTNHGGDGSMPDMLWRHFNGGEDDWGYRAWDAVADGWTKLIESRGKTIDLDIAREVFEIYRSLDPLGWDQLEKVVNTKDWSVMIEVRQELSRSLPRANVDSIRNVVKTEVLETLEGGMADGSFWFGNFQAECDEILKSLVRSDRLDEYFDVTTEYFSEVWNKCMTQTSPGEAWGMECFGGMWSDAQVGRQRKMAEVSGVKYTDSGALRFVFLKVEEIYRHCFENAVDPERQRCG